MVKTEAIACRWRERTFFLPKRARLTKNPLLVGRILPTGTFFNFKSYAGGFTDAVLYKTASAQIGRRGF